MFGNSDRQRAVGERTAEERERARLERIRRRNETTEAGAGSDAGQGAGEPDAAESIEAQPDQLQVDPPWQVPAAVRTQPAPVAPAGAWTTVASTPESERKQRPRRLSAARLGALIVLCATLLLIGLILALFQPLHGSGEGSIIVQIPKGSSAGAIGTILARKGVVSSGLLFDVRALLEGKRGDLRSGRYQLRRDMSYAAALQALTKPPPQAIVLRLIIPEGETRLQIAQRAGADGLAGSYLAASRRSSLLDPASYGAPRSTPNLEGFLFPATYELVAGAPASRLVSEQLIAFKERFGHAFLRRAHTLGITFYEMLIIASMIEGEAELARDRPLVAAVIYNRLHLGMSLGIDATIRYAFNDYTHPLTEAQLNSDSPYNTRTHKGLPPTPIGNPGMAAIEAAAHPAHVSYLYYVAGADGCGELDFFKSYSQFLNAAAAYREAVRKNGGRVPTCQG